MSVCSNIHTNPSNETINKMSTYFNEHIATVAFLLYTGIPVHMCVYRSSNCCIFSFSICLKQLVDCYLRSCEKSGRRKSIFFVIRYHSWRLLPTNAAYRTCRRTNTSSEWCDRTVPVRMGLIIRSWSESWPTHADISTIDWLMTFDDLDQERWRNAPDYCDSPSRNIISFFNAPSYTLAMLQPCLSFCLLQDKSSTKKG